MPRLYREAPINAIWEGSGNVQCLDIARAIQRSPQTLEAYFAEVESAKGESAALDAHVAALKDDLRDLADFETRARDLCDRLAIGLQAAALIRAGSPVADAFCRSRLEIARRAPLWRADRRRCEGDREARRAAVALTPGPSPKRERGLASFPSPN